MKVCIKDGKAVAMDHTTIESISNYAIRLLKSRYKLVTDDNTKYGVEKVKDELLMIIPSANTDWYFAVVDTIRQLYTELRAAGINCYVTAPKNGKHGLCIYDHTFE